MRTLRLVCSISAAAAAACSFAPPPDVTDGAHHVGGNVRGLWNGAAVTVRLVAGPIDESKTIDADGEFRFDATVENRVAFTVTVDEQPTLHDCTASSNDGVIDGADFLDASITCTGPTVDISLSAPLGFAFEPLVTAYQIEASPLLQEVSFVVRAADATGILLDDTTALETDRPSPFVSALSTHTIDVVVGDLSQEFDFSFMLGTADVEQHAFVKASNNNAGDQFGHAVGVSGETLVVTAQGEDSGADGVNGDETNNGAMESGAAYVYRRVSGTWSKEAYLKASNSEANDNFAESVAISGDLIAVAAPFEDGPSNATSGSGAVYVFRRNGNTWAEEAYLRASNAEAGDGFGTRVALDGDTLAVAAFQEDSAATGINGNQADNTAALSGAVYVFRRVGTTWSQEAYIKASNTAGGDLFGASLALSGDTLVVATPFEDSAATGINGNQADNSAGDSGAAYVFHRTGTTWTQQAYLKASNTETQDAFGFSVALSGDLLVVGAPGEGSSATGIDGDQANESASGSGAVYVFARTGSAWSQIAYVKASNTDTDDDFGWRVAAFGDVFAVTAPDEDSAATGIDGDGLDDTVANSGAAYVFKRVDGEWAQVAYMKASNREASDKLGDSVWVSEDAVVVGAVGEDSAATTIDGDQTSNASQGSGAVYVFR